MIHHEIDWNQRLDDFWIAAKPFHRASHRGEIDDQRNAGEILKNDSRNYERNLFIGRFLRIPVRQRLDIFALDFYAVAIPQCGLKHNPNAGR